jgi:hypothetical protein
MNIEEEHVNQKPLEIAMEYQIKRDQQINRYCQMKDKFPHRDFSQICTAVRGAQALFELWYDIHIARAKKGG